MSRTSDEVLRDALAHLEYMQEHAAQGLQHRLVLDAVCMRLSAAIEALAGLDAVTRDEMFGEEWPLMWGLRNRIAHGYLLVDEHVIAATISRDVPRIVARIRLRVRPPAVD